MLSILLADDEPIERRYLTSVFRRYPDRFRIIAEAINGKEALKLALRYQPDIVIMDISMPVLDGLAAAILIKESLPSCIILLNTAFAEFEFAKRALDHGLDAYLLKPSDETVILSTIERCIQKKAQSAIKQERADFFPDADPVSEVRQYIDAHYMEALTLSLLADMAHFSPAYLSRLFHRQTAFTVTEYICKKRVEEAVRLLSVSSLPVREISKRCGFQNISNFNRVFRKYTEHTPEEIRKSAGERPCRPSAPAEKPSKKES